MGSLKINITASQEGLVERFREQAASHRQSASSASTKRRAAELRGVADGLETAARMLANTTFIEESDEPIDRLGGSGPQPPYLTPDELRRIADILESNSDQPGFDFASAVAAMEAEDITATAEHEPEED